MTRAAVVLAWITGLGFGLPCGYAIWYLADRGDVWTFLGFSTYGRGPFEDGQSQPASRAMRMASMRLRPPTLLIALDR
jgi:hypothetical protein